jgi:hypothetical protein
LEVNEPRTLFSFSLSLFPSSVDIQYNLYLYNDHHPGAIRYFLLHP